MPRNNYSPLPELSSLIRWTVQDVINWLDKNKLTSCAKVFREAGIDGNKLYNSTEADLGGIGCPRKDLGVLCDLIKQAHSQNRRGPYKQPVPNIQAPPRPGPAKNDRRDEDSGSEDDGGWSDGEFSDSDDGNDNYLDLDNPMPPTRPGQRVQRRPSYQDVTIGGSYHDEDTDSDSSYEKPVSEPGPPVRPSKNFSSRSGGSAAPPLPGPGRQQRPPPPIPQENHAPEVSRQPQLPGLRQKPSPPPNDENEEFYEEPDQQHTRRNVPQPPIPGSPSPRDRFPHRPGPPEVKRPPVHPSPQMGRVRPMVPPPEEVYDDPDAEDIPQPKGPQKPKFKAPAPPPAQVNKVDDQDEYETTDQRPPPPTSRIAPRQKAPPPDQEDYEQLDRPDYAPQVPRMQPPKQQHKVKAPPPKPAVEDQDVYEFPEKPDVQEDNYLDMDRDDQSAAGEDYEEPDRAVAADANRWGHQPVLPYRAEPKHHQPKNNTRGRGDPLPPTPKIVPTPVTTNTRTEAPPVSKPTQGDNDESDLERQKWFHGDIKRTAATVKLMQYKTDGMYLIRKSTQGPEKPYTLQIFYQDKDFNLPIRFLSNNNQYALGAYKAGETTFPTLRAMVNFFKKNFLVLAGGYQTTLVKSLPKS